MSDYFEIPSNLEYLYETTRKSKQYRRNNIIERIQIKELFKIMKENNIDCQGANLRVFFYQYSSQSREQLQKDYCSEFLTHLFNFQRSFNLRISIISNYDDSNLSIYDIILEPIYNLQIISEYLKFLLTLDSIQFC